MVLEDCPRCGTSPVELARLGTTVVERVPACGCYPKPPACPCCRQPLEDGRCSSMDCPIYGVLVPVPVVDPLWGPA